MPIGTRAKLASFAVALFVTALIGLPAFATDGSDPGGTGVLAFAKPTDRPRPSHPHATPIPTATPRPTPAPTSKPTARPTAIPAPDATPARTDRPRKTGATPKPSRDTSTGAPATAEPSSTPRDPDDGLSAPGSGATTSRGPSSELLGSATLLAALVGIGTLWFLAGRRRRSAGPVPSPVAARVRSAPPPGESWTNVGLDDTEALPRWLRLDGEPERAQLAHIPPIAETPPLERPASAAFAARDVEPGPATDARAPERFLEPLGEESMRLVVGAAGSDLLDQPNGEVGVVLATLIAGDEVEIQDLADPWVRVMTPLGTTGWIRSEALGFGAPPADAPAEAPPPARTETPARAKAPPAKRRGPRLPRRAPSAEQPS